MSFEEFVAEDWPLCGNFYFIREEESVDTEKLRRKQWEGDGSVVIVLVNETHLDFLKAAYGALQLPSLVVFDAKGQKKVVFLSQDK